MILQDYNLWNTTSKILKYVKNVKDNTNKDRSCWLQITYNPHYHQDFTII